MNRRNFLQNGAALGMAWPLLASSESLPVPDVAEHNVRPYWVRTMLQIADPVLIALSQGRLKETMPVEAPHGNAAERRQFTYLEAMGRLLTGMAPWLESGAVTGEEGRLRARYAELARAAIRSATNPQSPDFMNFNKGSQPVVDAAFLALAIVRAPNELWRKLDGATQSHVIQALQATRVIRAGYNNWILFPAMVEAALATMGAWWDPMRVDYAVRTLDTWYKGDGLYGDGPEFHWDYYNSFVIHPMLLNILDAIAPHSKAWDSFRPRMFARSQRYAVILERLIAPDASFPPIGRSLCYRFGAFQLLSEMSLRHAVPNSVPPPAVRSGLTAVMRRMLAAPDVFDKDGWLTVGFYGHQPSIAESYISTGSCYMCSAIYLPLGLPASDPFWSENTEPWTSQRVWSGAAVPPDHALEI